MYKTEITIHGEGGEPDIMTTNTTIIGGRLFNLEMLVKNVDFTKHLFLDSILTGEVENSVVVQSGINIPEAQKTVANFLNRKLSYFMIGTGGIENPTTSVLYKTRNWETHLYNAVPFRCVPVGSDLDAIERAKYRLRVKLMIESVEYWAYYGKVFDPGDVNLTFNDAAHTPEIEDSTPVSSVGGSHPLAGDSVLSYISLDINVSSEEFKEYYRATHQDSLVNAKISELALVVGNDFAHEVDGTPFTEIAMPESFSKFTHSPIYLDADGKSRKLTYKIFT